MAEIRQQVVDLAQQEATARGEKSDSYGAASAISKQYGMSTGLVAQAALVADYVKKHSLLHIHAHFATESAFVAMVAAKVAGVSCSFTSHAYDIFRTEDTGTISEDSPKRRLEILLNGSDAAFTISGYNRDYIARVSDRDCAGMQIIHCGIDPEKFRFIERAQKNEIAVLCVGRFVEKKGYQYLLSAFRALVQAGINSRLRIVGEGTLLGEMQELSAELGIADRTQFLGSLSSEAVRLEMEQADIFALHSVTAFNGDMEGIPVSIMEAAATGLPVVSTRHAGIPDLVIDGETGFLVQERDVTTFARMLIDLASSHALRLRMGEAGRRHVLDNFHLRNEAEKLVGTFMHIVKERTSRTSVTDEPCLVDIIMPTFNPNPELLKRAIESIVAQELTGWKLLVVKDGGDVDVSAVMTEVDDPRVEFYELPHGGKPAALNFAIGRGSAKYIAYLDDDDIWYPNHLKTAITYMEETGVEFVHTDAHEVTVSRTPSGIKETARSSLNQGILTDKTLVSISHINSVHTRRIIEEAGEYDLDRSFFIDWDMFIRMGLISKPVHLPVFTCEHFIYIGSDKKHTNTITGIHKNDPELSLRMQQEMYKRAFSLFTPEDFAEFVYDYRSNAWHLGNARKEAKSLAEALAQKEAEAAKVSSVPAASEAPRSKQRKKKTLLFVDYAVPQYDMFAGSRTNFMYLKLLAQMDLNVMFLPADFKRLEPYTSELNQLGIKTLDGCWFRDNWQSWLQQNGKDLDYVFFHKPDPAMKFLDAVKCTSDAAIIYQCHDLHHLRLSRKHEVEQDPGVLKEAREYEKKERYIFEKSDVILTFSDHEEQIIRESFPDKRVETVPLFFYDSAPNMSPDFSQRADLLFVGGFDHAPNRDAVIWFCKEVFPLIEKELPEVAVNIVGAKAPQNIADLSSNAVRILGKVSDAELEALYAKVKLAVIPLRYGAGVKGKTIEALYHGVPVVSTSIGLEGIKGIGALTTGQDDPAAFAEMVVSLYRDQQRLEEVSLSGAAFIAKTYTLKKTAELMAEILSTSRNTVEKALPLAPEVPRLIAFYLPQYHPIAENDAWWGKGFTEWRNVSKAKPLFPGHYQPHIPADLGFYDLRLEETRVAQAELAKEYGIHGFCYYHYWFNGKRLLERPVEDLLRSGKPDFPFCICWANENWTRRWDGEDQQVLIKQEYSEEDDRAHIRSLFAVFEDKRYIRVDGKPLFMVYRTENLPDPKRTAEIWREEAIKAGVGDLYLCRVESIGKIDPREMNFDAAIEFAPDWHNRGPDLKAEELTSMSPILKPDPERDVFKINHISRYDDLVQRMMQKQRPDYTWFRCVTPSWDNSARRREGALVFTGSTPEKYREWLKRVIDETTLFRSMDNPFVFVNAWNEWAEGNHLEPDLAFGRAYLQATRDALMGSEQEVETDIAEFEALHQELLEYRAKNEYLEKALKDVSEPMMEQERKIAELEELLAQREQRIEDLLSSLSWKLAAPLRWGLDTVRRGKRG